MNRTSGRTLLAGACALVLAIFVNVCIAQETPADAPPPNILVIIGDDMGVETLASYGVGSEPPTTPNLDELAASGLQFNNFWSQPVCSPTRATLLTGRYGFRTGVGRPTGSSRYSGEMPETPAKPVEAPVEGRGRPGGAGGAGGAGRTVGARNSPGLGSDEFTLPKAFSNHPELGYASAAFGKWHLADRSNGWERHPNRVGFDHFSGLLQGFPEGYFAWVKVVNGEFSGRTGYAPSDKVDDAIRWIEDRADQPWFAWVAFNLPHLPLHLPPKPLWVNDYSHLDPSANPDDNPQPYFQAMMEAMDTEIGRLLGSIPPSVLENTYVVFMGDNGTASEVVTAPFADDHAKGVVYEGGVNVPLIVTGPGVAAGGSTDALVNSTDMFATIMEMATIDPANAVPADVVVDAVSFLPYLTDPERPSIREWLYADMFTPAQGVHGGQYAIRDERYKLVVNAGEEEFFDLANDLSETTNLLAGTLTEEARRALGALRAEVDALHASEAVD